MRCRQRILVQRNLVLTTSGQVAVQFARQACLQVVAPPLTLPRVRYYLMWHRCVQRSTEHPLLRELIRETVGRQLKRPGRRNTAAPKIPR